MPLISVLMPCFNAAATLPEALQSLKQQSLADFEIVAVDDGSDDATAEILQTAAADDSRLRPVLQSHRGLIAALNAGLAHCRGAYLARMDADDRCHPERLARQLTFLEVRPEIDVVGCRVASIQSGQARYGFGVYLDWLNGLLSDADIRRQIFVESPLPHPTWMLHTATLRRLGGYEDHGWAEDYDLLLRLYLDGRRFSKLAEVLLYWRDEAGRLSRRDSRYSLENFLRLKAHYLLLGPLAGCDAVIVWGAGMVGRRLAKLLGRSGAPLACFVDINPSKIGQKCRGLPIIAPADLTAWRQRYRQAAVLVAVGARGARPIIRRRLELFGLREGIDWWATA